MISLVAIGLIAAGALWRAGKCESGWRFAPLRATGIIAGGVFRIGVIIASIMFAVVVAVAIGALRITFQLVVEASSGGELAAWSGCCSTRVHGAH